MYLTLKTAPTEYPTTLAEAKSHSRIYISTEAEDADIQEYIKAATQHAENFTGRAFITQTWTYGLEGIHCNGNRRRAIVLPKPPFQSIGSFKYYDTGGILQTLDAGLYQSSPSEPAEVAPAPYQSWPVVNMEYLHPVIIEFTCGYGAAAAVPAAIKQAIRLLFGEFYERRETGIVGGVETSVVLAANTLLMPYQVFTGGTGK